MSGASAPSAAGVRLYVGNLPYKTTEEELFAFMGGRDKVRNVKIVIDRDTKQSKGFGFVEFLTKDFADEALARNGEKFGGRGLRIDTANANPRPPGSNGAGAPPSASTSPTPPASSVRPVIGRGRQDDSELEENEHGRGRR